MDDILQDLNPAQREAVTATEGFVRVIAGAGSGKTRALTRRFAYLVNELGILPGNILCVTFTNKSAAEMRQRIHSLTGDNDTGFISTFHGFCVSVLQEDSHAVQYPKSFLVLDNADIDAMLRIIYEERGLTLRNMTFASARDMIEIRKIRDEPEYYLDVINMSLDTLREKYQNAVSAADIIFYGYLYQEKKCFGLDYNDLIKFTLYIFQQDADIRLKWQKRLEYIMVDEFQDIDGLQYHLMEVLCGYHRNLFIVGDPDQTIYTWRGADVKFILEFPSRHTDTRTILLNLNYRSTPEILAASNALISKNQERVKKELTAARPSGKKPLYFYGKNQQLEADWITAQMRALHEGGASYTHMAVLYRAHYVSRTVEESLIRNGIPYVLYSGVEFYKRKEVKDVICYLRMIYAGDDLSFLRTVNEPRRGIGRTRIAALKDYAALRQCSLYEALTDNLETELFRRSRAREYV